jgi:low molecular weight phosphotyrosine protein phosphatase
MNICFVCLGNICRSPMAAAIMQHLVTQHPRCNDWVIDSCGTGGWHVGHAADPRTVATLDQHSIPIRHQARQLAASDFTAFDYLLAMDEDNLAQLQQRKPKSTTTTTTATIALLGSYDPHGVREVPDPYYGGDDGFERIYQQIQRCCNAFMAAQANR